MKVANWETWQTYRTDRPPPPWIKIYRRILFNPEWAQLSDAEKGQLASIWVVAADRGGEVPEDPEILRKLAQLDTAPNVNRFIELGFLASDGRQCGVNVASIRRQNDAPEAEAEAKAKAEAKAEGSAHSALRSPDNPGLNIDAWHQWYDYRQTRSRCGQKPWTDETLQKTIDRLAELSHDQQASLIDYSVDNYRTLYWERINGKGPLTSKTAARQQNNLDALKAYEESQ